MSMCCRREFQKLALEVVAQQMDGVCVVPTQSMNVCVGLACIKIYSKDAAFSTPFLHLFMSPAHNFTSLSGSLSHCSQCR
jgi:hypothetical protein